MEKSIYDICVDSVRTIFDSFDIKPISCMGDDEKKFIYTVLNKDIEFLKNLFKNVREVNNTTYKLTKTNEFKNGLGMTELFFKINA